MKNLKTLTLIKDDEEDDTTTTTTTTTSISFPIEIIQNILSSLPIKPILRFRSVSKQWLSFISHDPSFHKLHSLAAKRPALLISAYSLTTKERHFLSAPPDGGPATHLITLDNAPDYDPVPTTTSDQHLNGLVLVTYNALPHIPNFAFVINPTTRKGFKLPVPAPDTDTTDSRFVSFRYYFFGFHQSRNEHYVLYFRIVFPENINFSALLPFDMADIIPNAIEFMIYSLSTFSWRKIDVSREELPIDITCEQWYYKSISSVCVNSVIHLMLETQDKILAFDLTTEKFSTIDIPRVAIPREMTTSWLNSRGTSSYKQNHPYLMDINGCLGLVSHDRVVERNEMYFWILQDYDNRVWVKETITFSKSWSDLYGMYPVYSVVGMDKIVFLGPSLSCEGLTIPIYDMKTKDFKLVQCTLGEQFLHSDTMWFEAEVTSYVESILPLEKNEEALHEDD